MGWSVPVSNKGGDFEKVPAGTYPGVLVAIIDLGTQWNEFKGVGRYDRRLYWVWELPTIKMKNGKSHTIACDFTMSLNKKAKLRQVVQARSGKELREGEEYDILQELGKAALIGVVANGEHTNFGSLMAIPAGFPVPQATLPLTTITLDEFRSGTKTIPDWVPYSFGAAIPDLIKTCKEIAGERGAKGGVPQGQNGQGAASTNGNGPPPLPGAGDVFWVNLNGKGELQKLTAAQIKEMYEGNTKFDLTTTTLARDGGDRWAPLPEMIPESSGWVPF